MDTQLSQSGIFPKFYMKAIPNKAESEKAGRPIYRDAEYVEIRIAGDKGSVVSRKVRDEDRNRWPELYGRFKKQQEASVEGTPVEEWPVLSASKVAELKALNIFTVEALAELKDSGLANLGMGARDLQAKAKAYLDASKDSSLVQKQASEIEELKRQVDFLKKQITDLGKEPEEKPKRGRPRKAKS